MLTKGKKIGIGALVGALFGIPIAYTIHKNMMQNTVMAAQRPGDITDAKVCADLKKYWYGTSCHDKPY